MSEVNHSHYKQGGIQPVEYIESNDLNFNEGNVVKYVTRWCFKNGAQDICKVIHYGLLLLKEYFAVPSDIIDQVMGLLEPYNKKDFTLNKDVKRAK